MRKRNLEKLNDFHLRSEIFMDDEIYFLCRYQAGNEHHNKFDNPLVRGVKNNDIKWMHQAATDLAVAMKEENIFKNSIFVPIPTSKLSDKRTEELATLIARADKNSNYEVKPFIQLKHDTRTSHFSEERVSGAELRSAWKIVVDSSVTYNSEEIKIVIFDDVLNHGTHFRAAHDLLKRRFPLAKIYGVILALTNRTEPGRPVIG